MNSVNGTLQLVQSPKKHCAASTPVRGEQDSQMTMSRMAGDSACHFSRISQSSPTFASTKPNPLAVIKEHCRSPVRRCLPALVELKMASTISLRRRLLSRRAPSFQENLLSKRPNEKQWCAGLKKQIMKHLCSSSSSSEANDLKSRESPKEELPAQECVTDINEEYQYFRRATAFRQSRRWRNRKGCSSLKVNNETSFWRDTDYAITTDQTNKTENQIARTEMENEREVQLSIRLVRNALYSDQCEDDILMFQTIIRDGKQYTWC